MRDTYTRKHLSVKSGFRAHYTLRLGGAAIHLVATHGELLDFLSRISRRAA
jgi:hypothetical protein